MNMNLHRHLLHYLIFSRYRAMAAVSFRDDYSISPFGSEDGNESDKELGQDGYERDKELGR